MPLKLGIPRETSNGERRVSIDPTVLSNLSKLGIEVILEKGAGDLAFFSDEMLSQAVIVDDIAELSQAADVIWRVQPPTADEVKLMREGSVLIGTLKAHDNIAMLKTLEDKKLTSFSLELIPRIPRSLSMDVVHSQSAVAGYKAALMAADLSPRLFPLMTTPSTTIRPSKVVVIGAGASGLQAIATAKRLGAIVEAYDVRQEMKEQIESLGAKAIEIEIATESDGSYAKDLTASEREQQQQALSNHIEDADVLITTALAQGRSAPKIISKSIIERMKQGSILIDLSAEDGGNCSLTKAGKIITHHGVTIYGPLNVASQVPTHASQMYAQNLYNFMMLLVDDNYEYSPNFEDEIVLGALLTKDGEVMHEGTLELLNKTLGEK